MKGDRQSHLWDASKPLRFAPTTSSEEDTSAPRSIEVRTDGRSEAGMYDAVDCTLMDRNSTAVGRERVHALAPESVEEQLGVDSERSLYHEPSSKASIARMEPSSLENRIRQDNDNTPEQERNFHIGEEDVAEEHEPLSYQVPEDVMRAAMMASPNTRASFWSTKLYQGPRGESLATHYCKSMDVADRVAQYFLNEKVVGFDIEWKTRANPFSIKQNASLIQLACENRIALFHISLFPGNKAEQLMPPSLKAVLESPNIYKVGVAVKGDFSRLEKYLGVQAQGVFELSRLHNLVEWYETDPNKVSNRLVSLATQVLQHLQLPLYKGTPLEDEPDNASSVRVSDWSQSLDLQQIHYAAADAYAGFRLYDILEWKRKQMKPTPAAIQLCDYDSKPVPRSKDSRKSTKAAVKPKAAARVATESEDHAVDQGRGESDDAEEVEGYETAPEELMDSHQLEDPVSKPPSLASGEATTRARMRKDVDIRDQPDQDMIQPQKRVGRLNLSELWGPDPRYPVLPHSPDEIVDQTSPSQTFYRSTNAVVDPNPLEEIISSQLAEVNTDEDGEFGDPELEEALRVMEIDNEGRLGETKQSSADIETGRESRSISELAPPNVSPGDPKAHIADNEQPMIAEKLKSEPAVERLDSSSINSEPQKATTRTTTVKFKSLITLPNDTSYTTQYDLATKWAQTYLESTVPSPTSTTPSRIRATVSHLRAYHLWHHQKLLVDDIALHLRDPPLSTSTVTSYIVQAISLEGLAYEKEPLHEVMMAMPSGLRKGRWKWLAGKVGALD